VFFLLISKSVFFSGQELKSELQISLSLGEILNSAPDVDGVVYLTSYCEQLTGKIKCSHLKVPEFLQLTELESLINSYLSNISHAVFRICNFFISEYSSLIKTISSDF